MGLSPGRGGAIPPFIKFRLFQEQLFTVELGAVARVRLAFRMLTFTNKISISPEPVS